VSIRVRFAPSPTGFLHMGSLRTALFTCLLARAGGGSCILRIEDTDQKREVEGATERLIQILDWVGITFDEGPHVGGPYGPYVQTERLHTYAVHADLLLKEGKAYRCFCTTERLDQMRAEQTARKMAPQYDRRCRDLPDAEVRKRVESGEPFVIRQKMPLTGEVLVHDELRGDIRFQAQTLDDHVLMKSNGVPTYQFANVVDDHLMEITHVTRAEEWLPSFPKNALLYKDFGWGMPMFVHYPIILSKGGGKLSKRHGDVMVEDYREKGYLPEALINFSVLLGWHPKDDNELLSLAELEKVFTIEGIGTSPAVFDIDKLDYFNAYYIRRKPLDALLALCLPYLAGANLIRTAPDNGYEICATGTIVDAAYLKAVLALEQERIRRLSEVTDLASIFFSGAPIYDPALLVTKKMTAPEARSNLEALANLVRDVPGDKWSRGAIEEVVGDYLKAGSLKVGNHLWPFRVALTGRSASPGVFEVAEVLGKGETIRRMDRAISALHS
jgi:glutamyl-tRNA synthetase